MGFDAVFTEFLKVHPVELLGRAFKEIEKLFLKVFLHRKFKLNF